VKPEQIDLDSGIAGLILAAGRSTRMSGGSKLLADFRGTPVIREVVSTALAADLDPVVVVVRQGDAGVWAALDGLPVRFAVPPPAPEGRMVSVITGITALRDRIVTGAMLLLGDEPGLDSDHVRTVRKTAESGASVALRAEFRDRPGHPVYLPETVLREIPNLSLDHGPDTGVWDLIVRIGLPHRGVPIEALSPIDIDTRDDLSRAVDRGAPA
jgi:molybdenum cofactor cytidylyltransferase